MWRQKREKVLAYLCSLLLLDLPKWEQASKPEDNLWQGTLLMYWSKSRNAQILTRFRAVQRASIRNTNRTRCASCYYIALQRASQVRRRFSFHLNGAIFSSKSVGISEVCSHLLLKLRLDKMWKIGVLILSISGMVVTNILSEEDTATNRESRILPIFQIVKFPNDVCTGSTRNGTCYTA